MAAECPFPGLSSQTSFPLPLPIPTPRCLCPFPNGNTDPGCHPTSQKTDLSHCLPSTSVLNLHPRLLLRTSLPWP